MATYQIETEDGAVYEIETEDAPQEQKQGDPWYQKVADVERGIGQRISNVMKPVTNMAGPAAAMSFRNMPIQQQMLAKAAGMAMQLPDMAGEAVAEGLAGGLVPPNVTNPLPRLARPGEDSLRTSPNVAAAIGTGLQMAPDLIGGGQALASRKVLEQGVRGAGRAVKSGLKKAGGRILEGPATKEMRLLRDSLSDMPLAKVEKEAQLEALRVAAGKEIEATRASIGVPQKLYDTANMDKTQFANMMKTLKPKTNNYENLLKLRDRADAVLRSGVDDTERAFIRRGMQAIDDQLAKLGKTEKLAKAYKKYGEVMRAADDIGNDITRKKVASAKRIRELGPKSNVEKALRKWAIPATGLLGFAKYKLGS